MITAFLRWGGDGAPDPGRCAKPLLCAVAPALAIKSDPDGFRAAAFGWNAAGPETSLCGDPVPGGPGWIGPRTVLHGWIDNAQEAVALLGCEAGSARNNPAILYDLALAHWGDEVDSRLVGTYAAITNLGDGRLRLVRSPWAAPPLHYACTPERAVAASVIRVLFETGHPREVDYDYVADQLAQDFHHLSDRGWYRGISRVSIGTRVILARDGATTTRYYDPQQIRSAPLQPGENAVTKAHALLAEAAAHALKPCRRAGLMLSGGLDSPLAALAMLDAMPSSARLATFTFCPDPAWDGKTESVHFGNERAYVEAFAALHPRIDPAFECHDQFDTDLRDLLRANDLATANVANVGKYHGPWRMAREAGCDWLFNADFGNFTFSNDARWSYVEYLVQGRLGQLTQTLVHRGGDHRPLWRKVLALSVLPLLPRRLRINLRKLVHPAVTDPVALLSPLSAAARAAHADRARQRDSAAMMEDYHHPRSRAEYIQRIWESADSGEDVDLAFERLHGIRRRDITAYRPLIEFCLGLPTEEFIKDGMDRRLARRMAEGRLPEPQRLERRTGAHNPDWHVHLSRRRGELIETIESLRDHPVLAEMLDLDRLRHLLEDWPETAPLDPTEAMPRAFALTRALTAASFVRYAEGRNDF